jgi:anti-anti-sigma regulatory factor
VNHWTQLTLTHRELMRAVMGDTTAGVVDMNSVSFFSCGGLQMLVETRDMARACQVRLRWRHSH